MQGFHGFPQKGRLVKIPSLFFSTLLPQIDSLAELKVTLYCFWRLQQKEGTVLYLWESELIQDQLLMDSLASREDQQHQALQQSLESAVIRGTLLRVGVRRNEKDENLYLVNTARGRAVVQGIETGKWTPNVEPDILLGLEAERPNIFVLYEQNIGPLTPLIAEHLHEFESTYPSEWVEEAIRIATVNSKRNLSYIEAILKRWQTEGRKEQTNRARDGQSFISGKYRDEINY